VTIRFDKNENNLYFKATRNGLEFASTDDVSDEVGMSASEAGAKSATKRTVKSS